MKSLSQYINEKLMSIDEMIEDYNAISDSPDTATKKNIASKYGLVSKKIADIQKTILVAMRNERNDRRKYCDDDIIWFRRLSDISIKFCFSIFFAFVYIFFFRRVFSTYN